MAWPLLQTVNNINKWNQVQEELTNDTSVVPPSATALAPPKPKQPGPSSVSKPVNPSVVSAAASDSTLPVEQEFEFSDLNALTCLLCARQFKSTDQLKRHNKESDLHKKNSKDPNLRDVARQKLAARQANSASTSTTEQPKYRDRASERRVLFNQPDAPVPETKDGGVKAGGKKRQAEGPPPPPSPPPPPVNPGKDESNVGNRLLKMMGWTEGTGLGTEGEGRVDPISAAVYAQGVGLGASKGKDIAKITEASGSYVHLAKDAARERYGK